MNICDKCGARGKEVVIGDHCPECGQLVGWPVPGANSTANDVAGYEVEATDEQLRDAVGAVAERNFNTLMRRKRKAEGAGGFKAPVAEPEDPDDEGGTAEPPNADPDKATDPSVQPQPGADAGSE